MEAVCETLKRSAPDDFFHNWSSFRPSLDAKFRGAAEYLKHELNRPWTAEELAYMEGCPAPDADQDAQSSAMQIDLVHTADEYYFSDTFDREASGTFYVEVYNVQTYNAESEDEEANSGTNYYDVTASWTIYFEMDGDSPHGKIVEVGFDGFTYESSDW